VEKLFNVAPGAFRPPPKVESAFVRLVPHPSLPLTRVDEQLMSRIVAGAFSQRRKTLRNALAAYTHEDELSALGIDARLRPEDVAVEAYVRLAQFVAQRTRGEPAEARA
jgi:16S rRNA (adenine1518-N6/adenine1519-N6)-dimethyltransferase